LKIDLFSAALPKSY